MHFDIKEGVAYCKTIKVSCNDTDGNVCKEELPKFTNNSPSESLIHLLEEILAMQERFGWFVKGGITNNDTGKKIEKAHLSAFWESIEIERNAPTQVGKYNQESPHLHTQLFLRQDGTTPFGDFRGSSIYEEQCQYLLCETEKPRAMKVSDWIDRLEVIITNISILSTEQRTS